jgi:hypothetical protein
MIAQRTFHCPAWPRCGCPDGTVDAHCPGLEMVTMPPGNAKVAICGDWPECGCDENCERYDDPAGLTDRQLVFAGFLFAFCVVGLGLIWLAVR